MRNSVAQLPKTCLVAKNLPRGDYFVDHSDPVSLVGPMGLFGLVGQNSLIHNVHTYPTPTFEPKPIFLGIATDFKMTGGKWESVQIAEELGAK